MHRIVWTVAALLLLGGLYVGLQNGLKEHDTGKPQPALHRLSIAAPNPGEALPVFNARQGDTVTLAIRSDWPGELDVHGYEKTIDVKANGEVMLTFTAEHAGIFPIHLHELNPNEPEGPVTHRHVGTLDVQPE